MHLSDHDKVMEKIRDDERQKLIDEYHIQAIDNSLEYGFLNVRGHEVPDPTVMEPPLGYVAQPDLMEMMRRMITTHLSNVAAEMEAETFEEADDFDIDDDPVDYTSPYEMYFDPGEGRDSGPPAPPTPPHARDPNAPKDGEVIPPAPPPAPPDQPK